LAGCLRSFRRWRNPEDPAGRRGEQ
jgi:hypothetical protein